MSDCPRLGKYSGGCKFSPRYDVAPPDAVPKVQSSDPDTLPKIIEALQHRTYVRDVCETCGRTVERERAA